MSAQNSVINVESLACERGERLLFEGLTFQADAGDVIQIEGPNGSGKTTLLRCMADLFTDYAGVIRWPMESRRLYLGHKPGVRGALTAAENLQWLLQLDETACSRKALLTSLGATGLAGYEDTFAGELSAGQTKRIALARLYLPSPTVWLLDEPFAAIDRTGVARLSERIDSHVADGGTVVFTTHQEVPLRADIRRVSL